VTVIAVRFSLLPSQQVATQRCILNQTLAELRQQFATEMKMADELIQILFDGNVFETFCFFSCSVECSKNIAISVAVYSVW